ncbi:MAG TPA: hypothetical protein VF932_09310 [Anaerolineae bacterium]
MVQLSSTASRPVPGGKISSIFSFVVSVGCAAALVGIVVGAVVCVGAGDGAAALVGIAAGKVVGVGAKVCAATWVGLATCVAVAAAGAAVAAVAGAKVGATGAAQDTIRIPTTSTTSAHIRRITISLSSIY